MLIQHFTRSDTTLYDDLVSPGVGILKFEILFCKLLLPNYFVLQITAAKLQYILPVHVCIVGM